MLARDSRNLKNCLTSQLNFAKWPKVQRGEFISLSSARLGDEQSAWRRDGVFMSHSSFGIGGTGEHATTPFGLSDFALIVRAPV